MLQVKSKNQIGIIVQNLRTHFDRKTWLHGYILSNTKPSKDGSVSSVPVSVQIDQLANLHFVSALVLLSHYMFKLVLCLTAYRYCKLAVILKFRFLSGNLCDDVCELK